MGELRPWHIIVIIVVAFTLFGYKKLPDATRSLGRSLRILETEMKSLHDDDPETRSPAPPPPAATAPQTATTLPDAPQPVETPRHI